MGKIIFIVIILLFVMLIGYLAMNKKSKDNKIKDEFVFPRYWTLFGPIDKNVPEPDFSRLTDVPAELVIGDKCIKAQGVAFKDSFPDSDSIVAARAVSYVDLGELLGGEREGKTAYLLTFVTVRKDMDISLGAGADWWMKWWVNGEVVCDTTASGNIEYPFSVLNHHFTVRLRKGRNLIAVKVVSGTSSFMLTAGGPREMAEVAGRLEAVQSAEKARIENLLKNIIVKSNEPPIDFPKFETPGFEKQMDSLRNLFWRHTLVDGPSMEKFCQRPTYPILPFGRTGPLWDGWMSMIHLWPAVETDFLNKRYIESWRNSLLSQRIDDEGYVATLQNIAYSHNDGWPFPGWNHGVFSKENPGGYGWHFSHYDTKGIDPILTWPPKLTDKTGWQIRGLKDLGIDIFGWNLGINRSDFFLITPEQMIDTFQSPFLQLRWDLKDVDCNEFYISWLNQDQSEFSPENTISFAPNKSDGLNFTMIRMYDHPNWKGNIKKLRISCKKANLKGKIRIIGFFTCYDTRHNVNNSNYIQGCIWYFRWTGDTAFLRENISRIRKALDYTIKEFSISEQGVVLTPWVGHDGLSGIVKTADGGIIQRPGHGIGNNYNDIVPCGHLDCYATIQVYKAIKLYIELETAILANPLWNIEVNPSYSISDLDRLAEKVKTTGNELFWSEKTGRFYAAIDIEGTAHDYGYTLMNLEAVECGFATDEHSQLIMDWINGNRIIEGDDSTGKDIYKFTFAPRWTTKKNRDWWGWWMLDGDKTLFGDSVLDGGAILGWSFYDILSRINVLGSDNASHRLIEIADWYNEVQEEGGYKSYYDKRNIVLQGAGVGGSVGLANEFFESSMVPSVMLYGFLGFKPLCNGIIINPKLPSDWAELTIDRISWHGRILTINVKKDEIKIISNSNKTEIIKVYVPNKNYNKSGNLFLCDLWDGTNTYTKKL